MPENYWVDDGGLRIRLWSFLPATLSPLPSRMRHPASPSPADCESAFGAFPPPPFPSSLAGFVIRRHHTADCESAFGAFFRPSLPLPSRMRHPAAKPGSCHSATTVCRTTTVFVCMTWAAVTTTTATTTATVGPTGSIRITAVRLALYITI